MFTEVVECFDDEDEAVELLGVLRQQIRVLLVLDPRVNIAFGDGQFFAIHTVLVRLVTCRAIREDLFALVLYIVHYFHLLSISIRLHYRPSTLDRGHRYRSPEIQSLTEAMIVEI